MRCEVCDGEVRGRPVPGGVLLVCPGCGWSAPAAADGPIPRDLAKRYRLRIVAPEDVSLPAFIAFARRFVPGLRNRTLPEVMNELKGKRVVEADYPPGWPSIETIRRRAKEIQADADLVEV